MELIFTLLTLVVAAILHQKNLSRAIKSGDQQAFKEFFDSHYASLVRYVQARGLTEDEADDLAQNAFIYIWENREQIDPDLSLRAYLYRIVYSRMLNYIKREARSERMQELEMQVESNTSTEQDLSYNELMHVVKKAISTMPEKRRLVFESCFLQQLSYKETAEALQISVNTVENHMQKALKSLREMVNIYLKK